MPIDNYFTLTFTLQLTRSVELSAVEPCQAEKPSLPSTYSSKNSIDEIEEIVHEAIMLINHLKYARFYNTMCYFLGQADDQ